MTATPQSTDPPDEVTTRLRQGSKEAMSQVFRAHLDVIYNYCYRRCGSWTAADDLTSTVFLEVWRNRRRALSVDGSVLPWIYGIATNVCRNHYRSQRRNAAALTLLDDAPEQSTDADQHDELADRLDNERRLRQAIDHVRQLPQGDQDVFVLVIWEELSYAATAAALDIPVGTVRSRLHRVRRQLRLADTTGPEQGRVCDV